MYGHTLTLVGFLTLAFLCRGQEANLALADSLYATAHYTAAINEYAKLNSKKAGLQIARSYNAIGNYEKAIKQYESLIVNYLGASPRGIKRNLDLDFDASAGAFNLDYRVEATGFHVARLELGRLYLKTKLPRQAKELFTRLILENPDNPEYHYYEGEAYIALGLKDSSAVSLQKAVLKDGSHLKSLFQLGKYYVSQNKNNKALFYVDQGLQFYAKEVSLINLKALALYNKGAYKEAIPWFEKLLALGEVKEYIYEKLAYAYFQNEAYKKAKHNYTSVLEMNEENADAYYYLSQVYRKTDQPDSAVQVLKKSIKIQTPALVLEYSALAAIARDANDLETALEYYKQAFNEDTTNARSYYQICTVADRWYKDPKVKLEYYENFIKMFGNDEAFYSEFVAKRISQLKEDIHFKAE